MPNLQHEDFDLEQRLSGLLDESQKDEIIRRIWMALFSPETFDSPMAHREYLITKVLTDYGLDPNCEE